MDVSKAPQIPMLEVKLMGASWLQKLLKSDLSPFIKINFRGCLSPHQILFNKK